MAFKTAGILANAGVMVSITTDHPVSLIQSLPICVGLSVKHGLSLEDGFRALTINAAKIQDNDKDCDRPVLGKIASDGIQTHKKHLPLSWLCRHLDRQADSGGADADLDTGRRAKV